MKSFILDLLKPLFSVLSVIVLIMLSFYMVHTLFSVSAGMYNCIAGLSFSDAFKKFWIESISGSIFCTVLIDFVAVIAYCIKHDQL
jgi:hypothetical protein